MEIIDTDIIEYWPGEVLLGATQISEDLTLDLLLDEERAAFNSFRHSTRKNEFLSARHLFQFLLKEMNLDAEEVVLKKEKDGKPFARSGENHLYVSFSHSPHKVFCAISQQKDIGLDVEHISRNVSRAVLNRILNEQEIASVGGEDPIKLWTIKEAAVKSLGTGLRTNLNELTIMQQQNRFFVEFNDGDSFEICTFRHSSHQIALAF